MRSATTFREFIHARLTGRDVVPRMGDKLEVKRLVESFGFATPKTLASFEGAEALDLGSLPGAFVLKPHHMANSKGVMMLHRIAGRQGYWEGLSKQRRWNGDIIKTYQKLETEWTAARRLPFRIFAEERVASETGSGELPPDYKFFVFNGTIKLINVVDRNAAQPAISFFKGDFTPLADWESHIEFNQRKAGPGNRPKPLSADAMLAVVVDLSKRMNTPFIRIDMYASPQGPVVGELSDTPGPGYYLNSTFRLKSDFDAEMGEAWAEASRQLGLAIPQIGENEVIPLPRGRASILHREEAAAVDA